MSEPWTRSDLGLYVPAHVEASRQSKRRTAVDLFCGCGGFSLGLETAGIDVVAAVEWWAPAAVTYLLNLGHLDGCAVGYPSDADRDRLFAYFEKCRRNRAANGLSTHSFDVSPGEPGWIGIGRKRRLLTSKYGNDPSWGTEPGKMQWGNDPDMGCRGFVFGDIRDITGSHIREVLAMKGWLEPIDIVCGGPPCQGFSKASGRQNAHDHRNNLILEYLRVAAELDVHAFIMENVPELMTSKPFRPLWGAFVERANDLGYDVTASIIDAVSFGVPQHRRRVIAVGTKHGSPRFQFPVPTHWAFGSKVDGAVWGEPPEDEAKQDAQALQQEMF